MVPFTATLIESGGSFGGSTHEICRIGRGRLATLCAFIDGARRGARIDFIKTYDGSAGWSHAIVYDGALNADGTEIDGRWRGQGGFSGRFLMIRPVRESVAADRRAMAGI